MPTDITETATKGTTISVPIGTDTRTAASLMNAWQAIGNRIAWLEACVERLFGTAADVNEAGEELFPEGESNDPVIIKGTLRFEGPPSDSGGITFGSGGVLSVDHDAGGSTFGTLVKEGNTGRVPKKALVGTPATNQTMYASLYDSVLYTPGAAIDLQLNAETHALGEHVTVYNYSTTGGRTIDFKDSGGVTIWTVPIASGNVPSWVEFIYDGTAWRPGKIFNATDP